MHKEEQKKATRMNERINILEKELPLSETIGKAKEKLWANTLTLSMTSGNPSRSFLNRLT